MKTYLNESNTNIISANCHHFSGYSFASPTSFLLSYNLTLNMIEDISLMLSNGMSHIRDIIDAFQWYVSYWILECFDDLPFESVTSVRPTIIISCIIDSILHNDVVLIFVRNNILSFHNQEKEHYQLPARTLRVFRAPTYTAIRWNFYVTRQTRLLYIKFSYILYTAFSPLCLRGSCKWILVLVSRLPSICCLFHFLSFCISFSVSCTFSISTCLFFSHTDTPFSIFLG